MTDKEFTKILKEILILLQPLKAELKAMNETLDKILKIFKDSGERPLFPEEVCSK